MITIKGWVDHPNIAIISKGCERIAVSEVMQFLNAVKACGLSECDIRSSDNRWQFHFNRYSNGRIVLRQLV